MTPDQARDRLRIMIGNPNIAYYRARKQFYDARKPDISNAKAFAIIAWTAINWLLIIAGQWWIP